MRRRTLLTLVIAALVAGGCGSDSGPGEASAVDEPAAVAATADQPDRQSTTNARARDEEPAAAKATAIRLGGSQLGKVLFDRAGQAIYAFDKEQSGRSECYDACAAEWPPVITEGDPEAGTGIDEGLLGTTRRDDGKSQVTYNGHPLYFYAHEGRNQVTCHNVPGFGGLWLALDGKGNAVD